MYVIIGPIRKAKKILHNSFGGDDIKLKSMNARRTFPDGRCFVINEHYLRHQNFR